MNIPYSRWYPAIEKRRSRRYFDDNRPIEPDKLTTLEVMCKQFTLFPHARSVLVTEPAKDIFTGIIGSYGKIKNAAAFIAFVGDMDSATVQEEVGYTGEGVILEATALGLNTCWVGGFFRPDSAAALVGIKSNERVLAVTPIGYANRGELLEEKLMTGFGRTHRRLHVSKLMNRSGQGEIPEWIEVSLQAARLAPSAVNRQPWGFEIDDSGIAVYVRTGGPEFNVSKRLDCGIAMLHLEVAAMSRGITGKWQFLNSPRVARFSISESN